jgi:hypothetical protein
VISEQRHQAVRFHAATNAAPAITNVRPRAAAPPTSGPVFANSGGRDGGTVVAVVVGVVGTVLGAVEGVVLTVEVVGCVVVVSGSVVVVVDSVVVVDVVGVQVR